MKRHRTTGEISYTLETDERVSNPGESYVECTYTIRYQVTPYREECGDLLDVEILGVSLESAVAWIGDTGVHLLGRWDRPFEVNAVSKFHEWHDCWLIKNSNGDKWYPHRESIEALILEDAETQNQIASELWSE
jgi:hypothetical protein